MKDGIDPQNFSLQYIKVDQVIRMVSCYGPGALVAKFDVEFAYRNIPVHPDDRFLLGMSWHGQFFIDLLLPFGLRSAPFIFSSIADMVEWILLRKHHLSDLLHYLDDFITAGPPHSSQCAYNLNTAISVCHRLGLPLHADKCVGPATSMTVLGIELDSVNQVARLPEDKLLALRELIHSWMPRRWCRKRELESLIGHLHHAAKVVWPGRAFLHRFIDLLCCFRNKDHPVRINQEFRLDLQWWQQFLSSWHGVGFWLYPGMSAATDLEITSDAAGAIHPNGLPCRADEWTLCLFVSFLADSIQHSSIKVYLSAVRSLHIKQGFPDPLLNCLRLQRVLRGVKRSQGAPAARRLPITDSLLLVIHRALDLTNFDHCAFWAACMLGYFGFLRAAEFTVPNLASFSPAIHLSVADMAVDSLQSLACLRVRIKASKTDPFRQGCHIHIGLGRAPLCAVQALLAYLSLRGDVPGPLFLLANGQPLSRSILTDWLRQIFSTAGIEGNFSSHSFRIGAATVAARNGIPDHLIQALGRWTSNAYQLYIRTPSEALAGISSQLA